MEHTDSTLAVTAILLVSLPVVLAGLAGAEAVEGALQTTTPVSMEGSVNATADRAHVNVLTPSVEEAVLTADRIETRTEWQRGYLTSGHPGEGNVMYASGTGVDWHNFTSINAGFSTFSRVPQVLSLPGDGTTSVSAAIPGPVEAEAVENRTIAKHGVEDPEGTQPVVSFYPTLEQPHVALTGTDQATVTGNFTLFVNNVTIDVVHEEGTWSNWTGYNESNPDSPVTPVENPTAKRYEIRATTLNVTNGTLWVNATDAVDFYAKDANASVNGSISAPSVSGELLSEPKLYQFNDDPLRMWGQGDLDLAMASDGAPRETARAPGSGSVAPPLAFEPSGSFDVQPMDGVKVSQVETTSAWTPVSWFDAGTWIVLAVLGGVLVGAGVGAVVPERVHGVIGAAYNGWREHQYKRWARDAELAIENEDFDEAETLASRATTLQPEAPDAWMSLAMAQFGGDTPERALPTFREARRTLGTLPVLMFKLWVTYADDLDEPEAIVEAWLTMARTHPEYAVMMYAEEDFDAFDDERVQAKLAELKETLAEDKPELAAMLRGQRPSDTREDGDAGHGPEIA